MPIKSSDKNHSHIFSTSNSNIFDTVKEIVNSDHNGSTVFIPHVCNNVDAYGAGFAWHVSQHFPKAKADYHMLGKKFLKDNFGYAQIIKVYEQPKYRHGLYIVNMIAQNGIISHNNQRPLNYLALTKAMNNLSQFIISNTGFVNGTEKIQIHCPKFGSGLAGGNWHFISDLIDDIWNRYNVIVYNYNRSRNS